MMTIDDAMNHLDVVLDHEPLNALHEEIFRQAWQGKTYEQIATQYNYDSDYIRHIGQQLWQRLSQHMAQRVTKSNVQVVFRRHLQRVQTPTPLIANSSHQHHTTPGQHHQNGFGFDSTTPKTQLVDHPCMNQPNCLERYGSFRTLQQWLEHDHTKLIAILGVGGIGKTTLARQIATKMQDHVEVVLWRSLRNSTSFSTLMESLFAACPGIQPLPNDIDAQIQLLLTYFQKRRCLLILDNFESILKPQALNGQYQAQHAPYGQLIRTIADQSHQSSLILTSRESPIGLSLRESSESPIQTLHLNGLSAIATQTLMSSYHISLTDNEATRITEIYEGNPYAIKAAAVTIRDLFQGHTHHWLSQGNFIYGPIHQLLSQQISRLTSTETEIIHNLAQKPAKTDLNSIQTALKQQVNHTEVIDALQSLLGRSLLNNTSAGFQLHQSVQRYLQADCNTFD